MTYGILECGQYSDGHCCAVDDRLCDKTLFYDKGFEDKIAAKILNKPFHWGRELKAERFINKQESIKDLTPFCILCKAPIPRSFSVLTVSSIFQASPLS